MAATAGAIRAGRAFVELFTDDSKMVRGLQAAALKIKTFGKEMSQVGMTTMLWSGAVAAGFLWAGNMAAEFDNQMQKIATMLKGSDMAFMPEFKQSVKDFAKEFGKSTEDIATALYDILSAQVPAAKATDLLRASLQAAVAGAAPVKDATSAMLTLMETYGDQFKVAPTCRSLRRRSAWLCPRPKLPV
jgi:phage-related minor tail protein